MTIKQLEIKIINGGFPVEEITPNSEGEVDLYKLLMNPLAWQALGKSMGWGNEGRHKMVQGIYRQFCETCGFEVPRSNDFGMSECWRMFWHRFIDHLAEGKDIHSYFAGLGN